MKEVVLVALYAYMIGTINPSYLLARARGFDIRNSGSGNAGGSNALITMGKKTGVFCMLADILKAALVIRATMYMFPEKIMLWCVSASACTLGHMFPFYLQFHGGKGLACLGGTALALTPKLFPLLLAIAVVMAYITDYVVSVPITMCIVYPLTYAYITQDYRVILILGVASIAMLRRHVENIKRIKNGTEARFSYLWNKEAETQRLRAARAEMFEANGQEYEEFDMEHID